MIRKFSRLNKSEGGLTLIEVLIALVIAGIALTAIIKATSENIRQTNYLRQKTIALWVGQEVLSEARLGLINLPTSPDVLKNERQMLGGTWYYRASQEPTKNNRIRKIEVNVYASAQDEDEEVVPLIHLESYIYLES